MGFLRWRGQGGRKCGILQVEGPGRQEAVKALARPSTELCVHSGEAEWAHTIALAAGRLTWQAGMHSPRGH